MSGTNDVRTTAEYVVRRRLSNVRGCRLQRESRTESADILDRRSTLPGKRQSDDVGGRRGRKSFGGVRRGSATIVGRVTCPRSKADEESGVDGALRATPHRAPQFRRPSGAGESTFDERKTSESARRRGINQGVRQRRRNGNVSSTSDRRQAKVYTTP